VSLIFADLFLTSWFIFLSNPVHSLSNLRSPPPGPQIFYMAIVEKAFGTLVKHKELAYSHA
jgi:hypothetical protein